MKKLIAMLLALVMCVTMFTGCAEKEEEPAVIDPAATFAKYDPDMVVMTVDGEDVTWCEYFYSMYSGVYSLQFYVGDFVWTDACVNTDYATNEDFVGTYAMESILYYRIMNEKAKKLGIALSEEDEAYLTELTQTDMLNNCGEEATDEQFEEFLNSQFLTREVYDYFNRSALLTTAVYNEVIGASGEKITDEQIRNYIDEVPYISAKHILIKTVDDSYAALSDEEIAAAKEKADDLYAQLSEIDDRDKRIKAFDEFVAEYNEDPGIQVYPNGYTFTTGEMYQEFEDAAFALEEYEISEVVETAVGYHIIMRVPTTRESAVYYDSSSGGYYTINGYAASYVLDQLLSQWVAECDVQWADEFADMTPSQLFG